MPISYDPADVKIDPDEVCGVQHQLEWQWESRKGRGAALCVSHLGGCGWAAVAGALEAHCCGLPRRGPMLQQPGSKAAINVLPLHHRQLRSLPASAPRPAAAGAACRSCCPRPKTRPPAAAASSTCLAAARRRAAGAGRTIQMRTRLCPAPRTAAAWWSCAQVGGWVGALDILKGQAGCGCMGAGSCGCHFRTCGRASLRRSGACCC